jgi:divalent metal cation (Fe/Co/Zn/Cd) transporter
MYSTAEGLAHHLTVARRPGAQRASVSTIRRRTTPLRDQAYPAEAAAAAVAGVRSATVRGRWMGRNLLLEAEGRLDGTIPLAQADQITRQMQEAIASAVPAASHIHCDAHA